MDHSSALMSDARFAAHPTMKVCSEGLQRTDHTPHKVRGVVDSALSDWSEGTHWGEAHKVRLDNTVRHCDYSRTKFAIKEFLVKLFGPFQKESKLDKEG
eukprot:5805836-Amphidinium_carterae.1